MDDDEDPGEVFRIPDLWGASRYFRDVQETTSVLFSELKHSDVNEKLATVFPVPQVDDGFFNAPDLSFGPLSDVSTPGTSAESTDSEEGPSHKEEDQSVEEIWIVSNEDPLKGADHISWDAFEDQAHREHHTAYITEVGPGMFDAAIAGESDILQLGNTEHIVIKSHIYASSLLALGLGRSSSLFFWNEEKKSFTKAFDKMRVPGCTGETMDGLLRSFITCGNATRALQLFVDKTYQEHKSPGRMAMADAVSTLLATVQSHLTISPSSLRSFLQLQALFSPVEEVLTSFRLVIESVASAKSDEAMLSLLFQEVERLGHRTGSLGEILQEVLARTSRPFLDFVGEWIGLQREAGVPLEKRGSGKSFVKIEDRIWIDEQGLEMQEPDFIMDSALIPSFFPPEEAQILFETGRSLRFLRTHHSDHPLARADVVLSASPPTLDWEFSWQSIEKVEARAFKYEKDLLDAIKWYTKSPPGSSVSEAKQENEDSQAQHLDLFGKPEQDMEAHILTSIARLDLPLHAAGSTDRLSMLLRKGLAGTEQECPDEGATFAPPVSLTPILSFSPFIAAQARIINGISIRLYFQSHNLREHLSIQRRFQLLGDGVFSSRLSHALFDPELETAERRAGVARTGGIMGLRLEGRDSWPPASSELRLALMGVLTESYVSTTPGGRENAGGYLDRTNSLPGDLSFAVRDMTAAEIEQCKDPHSIEALDFLRLSYKPPAPLETIITPLALYKYDQLFKLLLRTTRMLFVVAQLFRHALDRTSYWQGVDRAAQRFRIEAHHFVSCLCGYFFDTGIDASWAIFERKLDVLEARLNDTDTVLGHYEGLDQLRAYHERVLDRILFALLLRKRQQPVMKLLEEIFTLILGFARHSRSRALGVTRKVGPDLEVKEMYLRFRKKVETFITVCRGLSEKKGYGERGVAERRGMGSASGVGGLFDTDELVEENTVAQLLARLEMSNYYSQRVEV